MTAVLAAAAPIHPAPPRFAVDAVGFPRSAAGRSRPLPLPPAGARPDRRGPYGPGGLLAALADGDEQVWRETVARFEGLLRARARAVLRSESDVDEAVQRTWVLLLRNAHRIADADRLPGWLSTTARREALAIVRQQQREAPSAECADGAATEDGDLAAGLLDDELRRALDRAVETLPESQRVLVRALLNGTQCYDELSRTLGMPRGSLGPLRGRAVRALRAQLVPAFA